MTFIDSLAQETNTAFTENGAVAHASTLDANLDFFSRDEARCRKTRVSFGL